MAVLGRDALDIPTIDTKEVTVPDLGGSIILRKLSGLEVPKLVAMFGAAMDQGAGRVQDPEQMTRAMAMAVYWSWVDESGAQVLTGGAADIEKLKAWPYSRLDLLNDAIQEFNGMRGKGTEAVAEAKKSLEPTQTEDYGIN